MKKIFKALKIKIGLGIAPQCPNCYSFNTTYLHAADKNLCFDCEHEF